MDKLSTLALFGEGLPQECVQSLTRLGFEPVALPSFSALGKPVASHTDLLVCPLGNKIFTYGDYMRHIPIHKLEQRGYTVTAIDEAAGAKYPKDIALNCLITGDKIFSSVRHTASKVLDHALELGYRTVNVRQGYARCTALAISDSALITADPSMARAAKAQGLDILVISQGGIALEGFEYGFIGGAAGVFGDLVFFAGSLERHCDGARIEEFCNCHGKSCISLSQEVLVDVGGIFFL